MIIKINITVLLCTVLLMSCASSSSYNKNESSSINLKEASKTNVQLAVGYINRGQYEIAQDKLYKAVEQDNENLDAYTTLAFLMMKLDRPDEAEGYYLEALDIKGKDPSLRNSYGTYLCRVNRVDEAMEEFSKAYNNPFYSTPYLAYSNAGTCLISSGDYTRAESLLRKAIKQQPEHATSLISMAELGIKSEKFLMARAYIQRYHAVAQASAESLWLQIQAEKALGAEEHYLKYAKQLLHHFPDSEQAGWVHELARDNSVGRQ